MLCTFIACIVLWIVLVAVVSIIVQRRSSLRNVLQKNYIFIIMWCTVASIFAGVVSLNCCEFFIPRVVVTKTVELVAMRTINGAEGPFVFGSGSIDSVMKYSVYIKNDNGSVSPRIISGDENVEIREMPDLKNVGYWKRTSTKFDYSTSLADWVFQRPRAENLIVNELDVPLGTVVHTFAAQ